MAETQTYQTHTRQLPVAYRVAFLILVANVLWTAYRVVTAFSIDTVLALLVGVAIIVGLFYSRTQALTVQNRVIRLEERLRYRELLPPDLAARAADLPIGHIVALRFASDAELPGLVAEVCEGRLSAAKDIKQQVRQWRGDVLRA